MAEGATHADNFANKRKFGFTLAEVLITLGIIGVVAAITLPVVINKTQEKELKVGYKKAYSDMQKALSDGIFEQVFTRTTKYDNIATINEFEYFQSKFHVSKFCPKGKLYSCWAEGDTLYNGAAPTINALSFVDASGRSWATFSGNENLFLVDINGLKNPNQFGKDRFTFAFADTSGVRVEANCEKYARIIPFPYNDVKTKGSWCSKPPCYYWSWLYK